MEFKLTLSPNISGFIILFIVVGLLSGCSDKPPIKIGFLGGMSGRVADLGIGGRNGATLALEIRNANGGINGQKLQLISEDDEQDAATAKAGLQRLIAAEVEAVIGPMTSSIAVSVLPQANAAKTLLLSPTATATALSGQNDYFMRVVTSTRNYAKKSAEYHFRKQGSRKVSVIYDNRNRAFTESWLNDYRRIFEVAGGQIESTISFESNNDVQFSDLVEKALAANVDSVLILANSVDTAVIAQKIRSLNRSVQISTSEWAATERLLELGGKAVEGIFVAQFIDRESTIPRYIEFRRAYLQRFGREPGFAGLTAYDAANVLIEALTIRQPDQSLREVILQQRTFEGAQSTLTFDANGDADSETYLTTIKNGKFQRLR
jgi:branched-chain amino acid transport system substrate-binding protein